MPFFPYQRDQYRPFYDQYSSLAGLCLGRGERIAEHMSTADVVRDLDLLRKSVGDRKLSYLGFSYGSYIGNTYANLFPKNVRALVIDGVLDPVLWSSGRQIESDRVATQEVFDEFLRLCKEAGPAACAFWDGKRTAKRWEKLARTIEDEPVDLGDGFIYTYDFLINDAAGAMYSPEIWGGPDGYAAFLDFVADVTLGDQSAKAKARAVRRHLVQALSPPQPEPDYDNGLDAYFGNQCADTEYPDNFREFLAIDRFARAGLALRPLLVVVQRPVRRVAGREGPLRRAVDGAHVGSGPRRRQLPRSRHRLRGGTSLEQAAQEQPPAELRGLGPRRLPAKRVHAGVRRRVPPRGQPAARRHGLSGEPEPVPRRARGAPGGEHAPGRPAAGRDPAVAVVGRGHARSRLGALYRRDAVARSVPVIRGEGRRTTRRSSGTTRSTSATGTISSTSPERPACTASAVGRSQRVLGA